MPVVQASLSRQRPRQGSVIVGQLSYTRAERWRSGHGGQPRHEHQLISQIRRRGVPRGRSRKRRSTIQTLSRIVRGIKSLLDPGSRLRRRNAERAYPIRVHASDNSHEGVSGEAARPISIGQLHMLPCVHFRPINLVVYEGPLEVLPPGIPGLGEGFPLICFQRLSRPHIATRPCSWRNNRYTSGASNPVLSY
jgi:hypothetical protein